MNALVAVRFQCKSSGKKFVAATFHMPCLFRFPAVMVIHTLFSCQEVEQFANGDPIIYSGSLSLSRSVIRRRTSVLENRRRALYGFLKK